MKKFSLIAAFALFLISCQKSNISFHHHWIVQEGHDVTTWSHATFCDSSDYGKIDTIQLDNTAAIDSNKFSEQPGSIYKYPGQQGQMDGAGIYDRNYCQLLKQID